MKDSENHWDVVVVGAGLAGMMAANCAARDGATVCVLEQGEGEHYPCNTRYSGGLFHIALDDLAGEPEVVLSNLHRAMHGEFDTDLAEALIENAPAAIRTLKDFGVRFISAGYDGFRRHSLAPPIVRRPGLHWRGRAGDVMLETLERSLTNVGAQLRRGVTAEQLMMNAETGRCVGVQARHINGPETYHAGSVILADGGFQADSQLVADYISPAPHRLVQRNAESGRGSSVRMAASVSARLVGMESFYGHLLHRDAFHNERLWPYPVLDAVATAGIVVDGAGSRYCDEGKGGVYIANQTARLRDPASIFVVFDEAIWSNAGRSGLLPANPYVVDAGGSLIRADSIGSLATKMAMHPDILHRTITNYNESLAAFEPSIGSPSRSTDRYRAEPIKGPTYYAFPACAGITYTTGGLAINAYAQVLHENGAVIGGLYACGACTGGLEGGRWAGYTGGLTKAATFGLIAGRSALSDLRTTA
ncbi:FAD-binding protein [Alcaligenaceae bacterium]|nr:FAD-binding protein [Alcaligenaceae bacterium]